MEVQMAEIPSWHIVGDWFDNCSCAVACPCTLAQAPDNGYCESVLFWHIRQGHYGDITLDGLRFLRVGRWEGDLWAGKARGAAGLFIDERADERQAEVLPRIIGGQAGGFPAILGVILSGGPTTARRGAGTRYVRDRARLGSLGSGDRRKSESLGESVDGASEPAWKRSPTHERARL